MHMELIGPGEPLWERLAEYAAQCPWRAGPVLARDMEKGIFTGWERVVAAMDGDRFCGFCTVTRKDCLPDVAYTPFIGFVFVEEAYRGSRISQKMIRFAMDYLGKVGFDRVYLVSDHENLYEKYGFRVIERVISPWGGEEKIYCQEIEK